MAAVEKRTDPEDGKAYTYDEIAAHYKGQFKKKAVEEYWEITCKVKKGKKAKEAKDEEPVEKRKDPEDGKLYTYDEIAARYKGQFKKKAVEEYWENICTRKPVKKGKKAKEAKEEEPKPKAKAKAKVKAKATPMPREEHKPVKYYYFGLKARGFAPILALEVGKVNYEVEIVTFDTWPAMKETGKFPFGYLAALELADGTMINETQAVLMAIGKLARLNGASNKDFAVSTMLGCKAAEVFSELAKVQPTMMTVKDWNDDKKKKLDEDRPKFDGYLDQFEKLCSEDGKFTLDGKSTGELATYSLMYHMKVSGFKTEFPAKLTTFYQRIEELEGVQTCLTGKSKMGDMDDYLRAVP